MVRLYPLINPVTGIGWDSISGIVFNSKFENHARASTSEKGTSNRRYPILEQLIYGKCRQIIARHRYESPINFIPIGIATKEKDIISPRTI